MRNLDARRAARWLLAAAAVAVVLTPLALLACELLTVLGVIFMTTPPEIPLQSQPVSTGVHASDSDPAAPF